MPSAAVGRARLCLVSSSSSPSMSVGWNDSQKDTKSKSPQKELHESLGLFRHFVFLVCTMCSARTWYKLEFFFKKIIFFQSKPTHPSFGWCSSKSNQSKLIYSTDLHEPKGKKKWIIKSADQCWGVIKQASNRRRCLPGTPPARWPRHLHAYRRRFAIPWSHFFLFPLLHRAHVIFIGTFWHV